MNLQQFIQQTGTKVTVLPAEPVEVEAPHVELERGAALGRPWEGGEEGEEKGRAVPLLPLNAGTPTCSECSLSQDISETLREHWRALLFIPRV